jgi:hypothetical protein
LDPFAISSIRACVTPAAQAQVPTKRNSRYLCRSVATTPTTEATAWTLFENSLNLLIFGRPSLFVRNLCRRESLLFNTDQETAVCDRGDRISKPHPAMHRLSHAERDALALHECLACRNGGRARLLPDDLPHDVHRSRTGAADFFLNKASAGRGRGSSCARRLMQAASPMCNGRPIRMPCRQHQRSLRIQSATCRDVRSTSVVLQSRDPTLTKRGCRAGRNSPGERADSR